MAPVEVQIDRHIGLRPPFLFAKRLDALPHLDQESVFVAGHIILRVCLACQTTPPSQESVIAGNPWMLGVLFGADNMNHALAAEYRNGTVQGL